MKKILFLLLIVPFFAFGQIDDEEVLFFGTARGAGNVYDFSQITNVATHQFSIKNNSMTKMYIVGFKFDEGLGVVLDKAVINPREEGKFTVMVDPAVINQKGDFEKKVIVIIKQKNSDGTIITKEIPYLIKGTL